MSTNMTEDRFEQRLRRIVSDGTDQRLAPPRSAPPFEPGADRPVRPQRRWVVALVAAACVLVLVAGAVVVTNVLRPQRSLPAGPAPTPSLTQLGAARIALPKGWVATADNTFLDNPGWCLSPRTKPSFTGEDQCPVWLWPVAKGGDVEPDAIDGWPNNWHPQCALPRSMSQDAEQLERSARRLVLGGRPAQWRRWVFGCPDKSRQGFEQYVVTTSPKWILYSGHTEDPHYREALTSIARDSQLPG